MELVISTLEQGMIYGIMALGVYILSLIHISEPTRH